VDESKRLSKVVAALVPCSRSDAERYIAEGWVRVDGQVVDEPQFRVADQTVEIDRRAILQPPVSATLLVHKPAGMTHAGALALVSSTTRWSADPSGIRRVKAHSTGIVGLLELPAAAEGLCVFSQDASVVRKLRADARLVEQELVAEVSGAIVPRGLQRLCGGLTFEGQPLPPARVSWQSETRLRFAVKNIRPEIVYGMCAQVGLQVRALRRIRIGRVPMAGLPPGQWRYLAPGERF
jgi:23S rRNA pseudouridine2604 synthase